jgi:hypothetical protein
VIQIKRSYQRPVLVVYGRLTELTLGWGGNRIDSILGLVPINDDCGRDLGGGLLQCTS